MKLHDGIFSGSSLGIVSVAKIFGNRQIELRCASGGTPLESQRRLIEWADFSVVVWRLVPTVDWDEWGRGDPSTEYEQFTDLLPYLVPDRWGLQLNALDLGGAQEAERVEHALLSYHPKWHVRTAVTLEYDSGFDLLREFLECEASIDIRGS